MKPETKLLKAIEGLVPNTKSVLPKEAKKWSFLEEVAITRYLYTVVVETPKDKLNMELSKLLRRNKKIRLWVESTGTSDIALALFVQKQYSKFNKK